MRIEAEVRDPVKPEKKGWEDGKQTWHFVDWDGKPDGVTISYRLP